MKDDTLPMLFVLALIVMLFVMLGSSASLHQRIVDAKRELNQCRAACQRCMEETP